jgi:hypothetical protein
MEHFKPNTDYKCIEDAGRIANVSKGKIYTSDINRNITDDHGNKTARKFLISKFEEVKGTNLLFESDATGNSGKFKIYKNPYNQIRIDLDRFDHSTTSVHIGAEDIQKIIDILQPMINKETKTIYTLKDN